MNTVVINAELFCAVIFEDSALIILNHLEFIVIIINNCKTLPEGGAATSWSHPGPSDRWGCWGTMYQYDYLWSTLKGPSKICLKKE